MPASYSSWLTNILSSIFGIFSVYFLYGSVFYLTNGNIVISIFGSCLYAFNSLTWLQSIQFEVFSLNNLFCTLIIYLVVKVEYYRNQKNKEKEMKYIYLGSYFCGLSLTNQQTIIFYILPFILYIAIYPMYVYENLWNYDVLMKLIFFFFLGMSFYFYLFIGGYLSPIGSWGNTKTFNGFLIHILRSEYGTFTLFSGSNKKNIGDNLYNGLLIFIRSFQDDSLYIGILLILLSIYYLFINKNNNNISINMLLKLFLFAMLFYTVLFHTLANLPIDSNPLFVGVQKRFWMQSYIVLFIFMSIGFEKLINIFNLSIYYLYILIINVIIIDKIISIFISFLLILYQV